jgi:hypothetical protein
VSKGLTLLSLALCIAAFLLSFRSLSRDDRGVVGYGEHAILFESVNSGFAFVAISSSAAPKGWALACTSRPAAAATDLLVVCNAKFAGFGVGVFGAPPAAIRPTTVFRTLVLPSWFVCTLLAIAPGVRLARRLARANVRTPTQCEHCGYDLRATPASIPPNRRRKW